MPDMPRGLTVVITLMLLGALGLFIFSTVLTGLGASGHAGTYIDPAARFRFNTLIIPPFALSIASVVAIIGIFRQSKFGWYLSILLWTFSVIYLVYAAFSLLPLSAPSADIEYAFVAFVILVNVIFIGYFQSGKVKNYFRVERTANGNSKPGDSKGNDY